MKTAVRPAITDSNVINHVMLPVIQDTVIGRLDSVTVSLASLVQLVTSHVLRIRGAPTVVKSE